MASHDAIRARRRAKRLKIQKMKIAWKAVPRGTKRRQEKLVAFYALCRKLARENADANPFTAMVRIMRKSISG